MTLNRVNWLKRYSQVECCQHIQKRVLLDETVRLVDEESSSTQDKDAQGRRGAMCLPRAQMAPPLSKMRDRHKWLKELTAKLKNEKGLIYRGRGGGGGRPHKFCVISMKLLQSVSFHQFNETIFFYSFLHNGNFNSVTCPLSTRD